MNQELRKIKKQKGFKNIFFCPDCETSFDPNRANIIEKREDFSLLQVECEKCKNSILSLVLTNDFFISNMEMITDLNQNDFSILKNRETITADQIIEFSNFLEQKVCKDAKSCVSTLVKIY